MATLPGYDLPNIDDIEPALHARSGIIRHSERKYAASDMRRWTGVTIEPPAAVRVAKRTFDLLFASIALVATCWLLLLIAIAIRLDSPGPVFYRQRRARAFRGRRADGSFAFEEFDMVKLRTMYRDAEKLTGPVLASEDDPRVTRVGRILRKTRLDELPQLYNVLVGDMTVVGPRPERPELFANLMMAIPYFEERMLGVKPGITGLAQVSLGYSGRAPEDSEIKQWEHSLINPFGLAETANSEADDMRMKLLYDLAYVATLESFSRWIVTELGVIVKTPLVMLRGLGR